MRTMFVKMTGMLLRYDTIVLMHKDTINVQRMVQLMPTEIQTVW